MRKSIVVTWSMALLAGSAGAALLAEETFDYGIGSASSSWTGGVGFVSSAWSPGTTGTILDEGLCFGSMQVSGGSAHIQFTAGAAYSVGTMNRSLNISSVTSGDLWMAYLFKFDTARSTIITDEALEVRPGAGGLRTGINENTPAVYLRYGGDSTTSASASQIKGGGTMLYVVKWPDMGASTGADAIGWLLSAFDYNAMMSYGGGLSESNLDSYAEVIVTNSFSANETLAGNVTLQLVPFGRNNSTPSFYVDELRIGTELDDVVAPVDPNAASGILLMEENWDYTVGSSASAWTGGVGFASSGWVTNATGTTLDNGLVFGSMAISGGSAHIQFTAANNFSASELQRPLNISSVDVGDIWMASLLRFDTNRSTIPDDEFLEIRLGAGAFRFKIDESTSAMGLRYGSDYSISASNPLIKGGETFLYIVKWPDVGQETGDDAVGWVLDQAGYAEMMDGGGLSEANLSVYAVLEVTNSFSARETVVGNVTLQIVPLGRNNSTPSFYVDELRMGTSLDVVVPDVANSNSLIKSFAPWFDGVMKMVVSCAVPENNYPTSTLDLQTGSWERVAHSDNGTNPFVVTNLDYSTMDASGTKEVIYVQSSDARKFFRIGGAE